MFKSNRVLAMDVGAGEIKVAAFARTRAGWELTHMALRELLTDPTSDTDPSLAIISSLQDMLKEKAIVPAPVVMSVTGQSAFLRLVKLPPVKRNKLHQTILYEAQQNVPFPINEVVWDYQLMGDSQNELNVMLVAIKSEIVASLTDCVEAVGLEVELVDVAPMALYNTVRYNYVDVEGCILVIDIGAKSTNLVFVEEGRFFSRNLPIMGTGNIITQQLMKEFNLSFKDAEELKRTHASVAFGGAYEDYADKVISRVSKTVRGAMTRLHVEVERTINFYRTQQGGNAPNLVLLAGGTSVIARTDDFFNEKLKINVEYLNPFRNLIVNKSISAEEIGECAHVMGEVVGVGLRHMLPCPLEINLLPPKLVEAKAFQRRQPFLVAAALSLLLLTGCWWVYFASMAQKLQQRKDKVREVVSRLEVVEARMQPIESRIAQVQDSARRLQQVVLRRVRWLQLLDQIHGSLLDGMWLVSLAPEAGPTGNIESIVVRGFIFADKASDKSVAQFRDNLRASLEFDQKTEIERAPLPHQDDYAREFTVRIVLSETL
ncbi:MAG: type IV pilus assembly protein PilM [Lentisphaerae bacterium]|nr:type IV pilus assembly protein PilM [Lentisphaerota bacterium]